MTWHKATDLSALGNKSVVGIEVNGQEIAIYSVDGEYFATSNICTHQFAIMSDGFVEDGCIECPLHQARFDIRTGAVIDGPAEAALAIFPVKIDGASIMVKLPD